MRTNARAHHIEARIRALFRRRPALCGFTVRQAGAEWVGEITLVPWVGRQPPHELASEIGAAIAELITEYPEAGVLLRARTFARVFH